MMQENVLQLGLISPEDAFFYFRVLVLIFMHLVY